MTLKPVQKPLSNAPDKGSGEEGLRFEGGFQEGDGRKKPPLAPPDWAERAAILEHDAGLTCSGAEARAAREAGYPSQAAPPWSG